MTLKSDLKEVQFTQNYLFLVKASLLYYLEGAPNFKKHKGHLISNCKLSSREFFQKKQTNEFVFSMRCVLVVFLEEIEDSKKAF